MADENVELRCVLSFPTAIRGITVIGDLLAGGDKNGDIWLWATDGKLMKKLPMKYNPRRIESVSGVNWGTTFITHTKDGEDFSFWDENGECEMTIPDMIPQVDQLEAWGKRLVSTAWDGGMRIWSEDFDEVTIIQTGYLSMVRPLGDCLAVAKKNHDIEIWNPDLRVSSILHGHKDWVQTVIEIDEFIVSGSNDGSIRFWDRLSTECVRKLKSHMGYVLSLVKWGDRLVSASQAGYICFWSLVDFTCEREIDVCKGWVTDAVTFADEALLASARLDGVIEIWNSSGKRVNTIGNAQGRYVVEWKQRLVTYTKEQTEVYELLLLE